MRNWMISLILATGGPVFIAYGSAVRNPQNPVELRWGMWAIGTLFLIAGAGSLAFGNRHAMVPFDHGKSRRQMQFLALFCVLFGVFGLFSVFGMPSTIPWEKNAAWIGWVFVAASLWAIMIGAIIEYAATRGD